MKKEREKEKQMNENKNKRGKKCAYGLHKNKYAPQCTCVYA